MLGVNMARLAVRLAGSAAVAGLMTGCVLEPACSLRGGAVQALECGAQRGDKQAQYELGLRLETGDGTPADPARAAKLYRQASSFTSGTQFIWVPGVNGKPGWVMPIRSGPDQSGLAGAQYRLGLMYLDGRGVPRDRGRAVALLRRAAKGGVEDAQRMLETLGEGRKG
jgi:TPR repeat protein